MTVTATQSQSYSYLQNHPRAAGGLPFSVALSQALELIYLLDHCFSLQLAHVHVAMVSTKYFFSLGLLVTWHTEHGGYLHAMQR